MTMRFEDEIRGVHAQAVKAYARDDAGASQFYHGIYTALAWVLQDARETTEAGNMIQQLVDDHEREQEIKSLIGAHEDLVTQAKGLFDGREGATEVDLTDVNPEYVRGVVELVVRQVGLDHDSGTDAVIEALGLPPGTHAAMYGEAATA